MDKAEEQLAEFLSKYTPEIEALGAEVVQVLGLPEPGPVVIKSISSKQRPRRPRG